MLLNLLGRCAQHHNTFKRWTELQLFAHYSQPFRCCDQHPAAAVVEDVSHLLLPQDRIDRHIDAGCGGNAERRADRLQSLVQIHRDPLTAPQPQPTQASAHNTRLVPELRIAQ